MAGFEKILADRVIVPVVVRLPTGQSQVRFLYAYPECLKWMKEIVPTLVTGRKTDAQTPAEQLFLRLRQWLSGAPINKGPMFRELKYPQNNDVWELKTTDLRMFGWMYRPRKFIIASHGYTDHYKEPTKIKDY